MASSPGAAGMAQELLGSQPAASGVPGMFRKYIGK
jgi:hypothetical protein